MAFFPKETTPQALASHFISTRISALPTLLKLRFLEDQMRSDILRRIKTKNLSYHIDGK